MTEKEAKELLLRKNESKNLDYKEKFNWDNALKSEKGQVIKDIIAMFNTQDGGKIVFGVRDKDFEFIGLSKEDFESFDSTKINDLLHNYTDPEYSCLIYKFNIDEKYVVIIDVPEFKELPVICKNNLHSQDNKLILQEGQIYIRTEKATTEVISSSEQMREFLNRAIRRKSNELLENIKKLIEGKSLTYSQESKERYKLEFEQYSIFATEKIGIIKDKGYWKIFAYPENYIHNRLDQKKIKELVEKNKVDLRGWDFPHIDYKNTTNFNNGRQSFAKWEYHTEAWRFYNSGLFAWVSTFGEDDKSFRKDGKQVLDFINVIYSLTEFFLFFKRYYQEVSRNSYLNINITLVNVDNRKLICLNPEVNFHGNYFSLEKTLTYEMKIDMIDLTSSWKEKANEIARKIFLAFNWDTISEETISYWQERLLKKDF